MSGFCPWNSGHKAGFRCDHLLHMHNRASMINMLQPAIKGWPLLCKKQWVSCGNTVTLANWPFAAPFSSSNTVHEPNTEPWKLWKTMENPNYIHIRIKPMCACVSNNHINLNQFISAPAVGKCNLSWLKNFFIAENHATLFQLAWLLQMESWRVSPCLTRSTLQMDLFLPIHDCRGVGTVASP